MREREEAPFGGSAMVLGKDDTDALAARRLFPSSPPLMALPQASAKQRQTEILPSRDEELAAQVLASMSASTSSSFSSSLPLVPTPRRVTRSLSVFEGVYSEEEQEPVVVDLETIRTRYVGGCVESLGARIALMALNIPSFL